MGIWTLKKDYMDKMGDIYKAAAVEVADISDMLDEAKYEKAAVNGRRDLSADGKNIEAAKYAHKIFELRQRLDAIRSDANRKARAVRDAAERDFYGHYNAMPDDIDEKVMAFINSGVATESEMLNMAKTANRTMKRIIGAKLAQSGNEMTAFSGRAMMQGSDNPHLQALDTMMAAGKVAMGGGISGPAGASEFLRRWDYATRPIYESAPDVGYVISDAGERRYYEGVQCPYEDN